MSETLSTAPAGPFAGLRFVPTGNHSGFTLEQLFGVAHRVNPNRKELLVSRVLGKHVPVPPSTVIEVAGALAKRVARALDGRPAPIVFGYAETATALGHLVRDGLGAARYLHSTRRDGGGRPPLFSFEEEHSHAPSHSVFHRDRAVLAGDGPVVLVDDELTTGRTVAATIAAIHAIHPHRRYVVATLLDWRPPEARARFEALAAEVGARIDTVALVTGTVEGTLAAAEGFAGDQDPHTAGGGTTAEVVFHDVGALAPPSRFGWDAGDQCVLEANLVPVAARLVAERGGGPALCVGTEEFMYVPLRLAAMLGAGVVYQSTTRSPIKVSNRVGSPVRSRASFPDAIEPDRLGYLYNLSPGRYEDVFVFLDEAVPRDRLAGLAGALARRGDGACPRRDVCRTTVRPGVGCRFGSYPAGDVTFLLKDLSGAMAETALEDREEAIQSGRHYCEMLPIEYRPTAEYQDLFHRCLAAGAERVAACAAAVAEQVLAEVGPEVVLVSLARAGTPAGILLRRYLARGHGLDPPHYSISIIRGRGLDMNAVSHIRESHPGRPVQFVDGWTGKGAIQRELISACTTGPAAGLDPELAVLADPGHCTSRFGTRDDFLIPSACLNATVSGLVSRTVLRPDLIGPDDFHGAKFYRELAGDDVSNLFVDAVSGWFPGPGDDPGPGVAGAAVDRSVTWEGARAVARIGELFDVADTNLIKPGVGEATRVLLRRLPWKVLAHPDHLDELEHLLLLARERGVAVEPYADMSYAACGLIRPLTSLT